MFRLAHDLTFPFDDGILTIPLTRELAALSAELIFICIGQSDQDGQNERDSADNNEGASLVATSDSPYVAQWPTVSSSTYGTIPTLHTSSDEPATVAVQRIAWYARSRPVAVPLFLFVVWSIALTLYTYSVAPPPAPGELCRWWCVHSPVEGAVLSYISLGLFLLLSFWLNNAYAHYESGVFLWNVQVRRLVTELTVLFTKILPPDHRPRALAHLSAVPFVAASWLRDSTDFTSLEAILAPDDIEALKASPDPVTHTLSVLSDYAYGVPRSCGSTVHALSDAVTALEQAIVSCQAVKKIPVPQPYTHHLALFITVWLALIPFTAIQQLGFFAVLVLMPIAYSVINLFNIGCEMTDPFGTDPHDIPVIPIAYEMRATIQQIYFDVCSGSYKEKTTGTENEQKRNSPETASDENEKEESSMNENDMGDGHSNKDGQKMESVSADNYPRSRFQLLSSDAGTQARPDITPSFQKTFQAILQSMPSVTAFPLVVASVWMVVAVFLSRALSSTWSVSLPGVCRHWCSPFDISPGTLANIGFALFTILSFRAADAIQRYEKGAALLYSLRLKLRSLAVDMCLISDSESNDLRRVIAHLIQVPFSLRDSLLDISRSEQANHSLLSISDWKYIVKHPKPVDYLLSVVESFILKLNIDAFKNAAPTEPISPGTDRLMLLERLNEIREMAETAFHVKRFPVIPSYTQHQRVFTALWLFLLPLSMTADTGWYTILWGPIIAYGVFGLETIANKLVDPFGTDDIDIPVDELCSKASNAVLEGVWAVNWGSVKLPVTSKQPSLTGFGVSIDGSRAINRFSLPRLNDRDNDCDTGRKFTVTFSSTVEAKVNPTLYAHFEHSIPWRTIFAVSCWGCFAVFLSYVNRDYVAGVRWWASRISVSPAVVGYVSFGGK